MKNKINTRKLTTNGILIALGVILHQITPPFLGMQADFSLAIMFIIIVMNRDYKTTFVVGIVMGIFAALTTKTVGGQLPSIIDKFLSANLIFLMLIPIRSKLKDTYQVIISLFLGTIASGTILLASLSYLSGLPMAFSVLMLTVVIPTTAINCVLGTVLYKIVNTSMNKLGMLKE